MPKKVYIIATVIILVGVSIVVWNISKESETADKIPETPGAVLSFDDCFAAGYTVLESYPRQCRTPDGKMFVEDIGNVIEKQDLIVVSTPRPNDSVKSPLLIKGEARGFWFFEASFPVRLLDGNGKELGTAIAQAKSDWMTEDFVPFEATLEFQLPETKKGTLILEKDNPSDLPENADELRFPVRFEESEMLTVKVFFNNSNLDPEFSCNKVFPVDRKIAKTQTVGRSALEELLKGTTGYEKEQGFVTNINPDVKIQSLTIENGVAKVDFDKQLEFQVGGSCRVAAIRAQITETLKQFSSVSSVIISIDGRTEDILQP